MEQSNTYINIDPKYWPELKEIFKNIQKSPYIYNFLDNAIKWVQKSATQKYITIFGTASWKTDLTFVAQLQWSSNFIFCFSKDDNEGLLYEMLVAIEQLKLKEKPGCFSFATPKVAEVIREALKTLDVSIVADNKYDLWCMRKEESSKLDVLIPPNISVDRVSESHLSIINDTWKYKNPTSYNYLKTYLEVSSVYGIFLEPDNTLASWAFKLEMGNLAIMYTTKEHRGKGFGTLLAKILAKEIAEEGQDAQAVVVLDNIGSQKMLRKVGFNVISQVYYINFK